jgi:hypothetical protein
MFPAPANGHIECFMYSYDVTEQELKNQIISKLICFGYENMGLSIRTPTPRRLSC